MKPTDFNNFIDLGLPTCAFMHGRPNVPEDRMRHNFTTFVREHIYSDESDVFVAENSAGNYAGHLWLHATRNRFNGRREVWIWDITVAPDFQRKGLGKLLLEHATQYAVAHRYEELWLLVSSLNDAAIQLYRTSGLQELGKVMCFPLAGEVKHKQTVEFGATVLRPLASNDAERLHDLWTASGLTFRPQGRDSVNRLRTFLNDSHEAGWCTENENQLTGAALLSFDGRKGWIERLAIRPEFRRAGLAKAIVTACMNSLKARNALVVAALIEAGNDASRVLFEGCGFVHHPSFHYYSYRQDKNS